VKLSEHYAHNVVIGRETEQVEEEEKETAHYLYCGTCDYDLLFQEVTD
jgi:hypothetical protein